MRVLISGAGIAGSTLAWFLAKTGAQITVVEKAHALLPHGQNVDIQGSAREVVRKMNLLDEVKKYNTTEKGTQMIDPKGRPFAPFPISTGGASFTSSFEILRGDLALVLYRAANLHSNVQYRFSTTIKTVMSSDENTVRVELSDGDVLEYDILVAADGQWSRTRKQIFAIESIKVVDTGMYAVYWTVPRLPVDNDWWNVYLAGKSRIVTLRPDPHGTVRTLFTYMPCNSIQKKEWKEAAQGGRKLQHEILRKAFGDAGWQAPRLLDAMESTEDFYFQDVQQIKMDKWSNGRVICLGDTAYAPSPLTGMGTSAAITGAYVLAGELSKLQSDEHPRKAFESYENAFRPFIEDVQKIPWPVPDIAHPETLWKRWLFHLLMRALSRIAAVPWIVRKFGDGSNENDFPLPQYSQFERNTTK